MADEQAVNTNARIITDRYRLARIDIAHLHDQTVPADHETRIRELQSTNIDLFVEFAPLPNLDVGCIDEGQRTNLNVSAKPDAFPSNGGSETDLNRVTNLHVLAADHRAES